MHQILYTHIIKNTFTSNLKEKVRDLILLRESYVIVSYMKKTE